ncbi:hypothetical protein [Chryseosolibacter indicus]|uniref:Uncharacterized protein n=1 Tax=Chryseosolibacter indicus TaxID=2782351 RepID=A0ABS5VJX1_9BACT|nr:hypothetical protein [Chryseosolibacter indicus]MBT1701728.1 hypothetical protein [Chryseosolibacter indicus]
MMKQVKLNTTGVKFTPSSFITYYEVNSNFVISDEKELLKLDEVKAVLNKYEPIIKKDSTTWSIGICIPINNIIKRY